ncbi:MAG: MCP four helix bundle domain-containing protein [Rubrivivax sp.]
MAFTIGKRVVSGFGVLLVLCAGVGTFGVFKLRSIDKDVRSVVKSDMPAVITAIGMESKSKDGFRFFLNHLLAATPDEKKSLEGKIKESAAEASKLAETYNAVKAVGDADAKILADLEKARLAYRGARREDARAQP